MSNSVEGFSAGGWNRLATQVAQAGQADAANPLKTDLPAIAPNGPAWAAFTRCAETRAPYLARLRESIADIQQFIAEHASSGAERQNAIGNLGGFVQTRVNCNADKLSPLVINENRRNLDLFAQQLKNPNIDVALKLSAALALAQGLGVCSEGETLNILESTQRLCSQQCGLSGVLTRVKNSLIDQHLQQLVKHEDSLHLHASLASELEIHHVQALKNHVASQWGLCTAEDQYATQAYQTQAGEMARELLQQTITPAVLAHTVAQQIVQSFSALTGYNLTEGMPAEQLKTEPLRQALQAEFGPEIELAECLEFNEDYSTVRLLPGSEIAKLVLNRCQAIGLIHRDADLGGLMKQAAPNPQSCLNRLAGLRGTLAHARPAPSSLSWQFWRGHTQLFATDTKARKQADQTRALLDALRRLNFRA